MKFSELFCREQYLLTQADRALAWDLSSESREGEISTFALKRGEAKREVDVPLAQLVRESGSWSLPTGGRMPRVEAINVERASRGQTRGKREGQSSVSLEKLLDDVQGDIKACQEVMGANGDPSAYVEVRTNGNTGEPFVSFLGMDRVGVALSGGGIRSATFNLGLLQGLNHHKLLDLVDYLSTVSGGGYIGGWWTAWKHRVGREQGREFPFVASNPAQQAQLEQPPEPDEIRHLREFSNFLIPRLGVFEMDMWYGVVAILSGMMPTLVMGGCLLGFSCLVWLFCFLGFSGFALASPESVSWLRLGLSSAAVMAVLTAAVVFGYEFLWRRTAGVRERSGALAESTFRDYACVAIGVSAAAMMMLELPLVHPIIGSFLRPYLLDTLRTEVQFSVLNPSLAWWLASLVILLLRFIDSWQRPADSTPQVVAASSRVLGRLLGLTVAWLVLSLGWEAGHTLGWLVQKRPWVAAGYGSAVAAAAETFRRIRSWMNAQPTKAQTGFIADRIKPLLPQILAYFVVAMSYVVVAAVIGGLLQSPWLLVGAAFVAIIVLVALCALVDPEALGLHWFYRERILRTYAGASNTELSGQGNVAPTARQNRRAEVQEHDDIKMADLAITANDFVRPLHLVCCTANDLAGDQLPNLYRGARSAVLSPHGVTIGDISMPAPGLTLSNAQTASAAAFNSQMGSLSRKFGPGVSFLMAALNLRLGLWIRVGDAAGRLWRGLLLLSEFWSGTTCPVPFRTPHDVHLSDGGHFENLGLYELVRRHCRFIIVSDCGADPEYKFDDLGAAMRRIRTDFGVEIDIDVSPLIPGPNGRAAQHMAVGTIYYDQSSDLGILLLFKPNLLGEEPDDVQQYRRRNTAFPQESTGDQFYDEAQWESYRRLGEHAARSAFRFMERTPSQNRPSRYYVFAEAFAQWYPSSATLDDNFIDQSQRLSTFVAGLRSTNSNTMIDELLPELGAVNEPADQRLALQQIVHLIQVLEAAFVSLRLDQTFTNPRTSGWDNLFRRSTECPLLRKWWPALQALYCRPFRQFLNEEYGLRAFSPGSVDSKASREIVGLTDDIRNNDPVWKAVANRYPQEDNDSLATLLFRFNIHGDVHLYVGMLKYRRQGNGVEWSADDLLVLPPLRRINVQGTYLWDVVRHFAQSGVTRIEVSLDGDPAAPQRTDAAFRAFQAERMRLYMALGFKLRRRNNRRYLEREIS